MKFWLKIILFICFFFLLSYWITPPGNVFAQSSIPAFPGAEGFGTGTPGGRGGRVIEVTNLNDSGSGSLRACVETNGPRICVFRTGGTIVLGSTLNVRNPYITIAGQTAPGGGITIKNINGRNGITVETHNVVIRYLTLRPGPGGQNNTIGIYDNGSTQVHDIIIDHCSMSWATDEVITSWYAAHDYTIQWSIISEGLDCSTHPEGCHSNGAMLGGYTSSEQKNAPGAYSISFHHNLMAHNVQRNPLIKGVKVCDIVNNIAYNPRGTFSHVDLEHEFWQMQVNYVGNYFKSGPQSDEKSAIKAINPESYGAGIYVEDNIIKRRSSVEITDVVESGTKQYLVSTRYPAPTITTTGPHEAYDQVLNNSGSGKGLYCNGVWFNRRDAHDVRVINDVQNGTGNWIDDPSDVGGWLDINEGMPCTDSDHDGMSDDWELNNFGNLNRGSSNDSSGDYDNDGYTDLEEFLNGTNPVGDTPSPFPSALLIPFKELLQNWGDNFINPDADRNGDKKINGIDFGLLVAQLE